MTGPSGAGVQRLLRPDQAAAALTLSQAGSSTERIAEVLAVPVPLVLRSLKRPEPPPAVVPFVPTELGPVLVVGERLTIRKLLRPDAWRAPVFVEDDLSWPPPATPQDRWQVEPVSEGKTRERRALREVALWGSRVLVDDARRVFCPTCRQLVEVAELGRDLFRGQDGVNGGGIPSHRLGLPPARQAPG